jgi:hypothetical protein
MGAWPGTPKTHLGCLRKRGSVCFLKRPPGYDAEALIPGK